MPEVGIVELRIMTATQHKRVVIALFHDSALLKHQNAVGVADSREPVSNQDGGAMLQDQIKPFLNLGLGQRVYAGGGLVEDENRGVLQQHASKGDKLALSKREGTTGLTYQGVQTLGKGIEPIATANTLSYRGYFLVAGVGTGVANIIGDSAREQEWRLRHNADVTMVVVQVKSANIAAID